MRCDFCYRILRERFRTLFGPRFLIASADVSAGLLYDEKWAACDECFRLLTAGDVQTIADSVVQRPEFEDMPENEKQNCVALLRYVYSQLQVVQ